MIGTHQLAPERRPARTLVRGPQLARRDGECWSVIGRNGAGKSTLLRTLAGLREPDAGHVDHTGPRPGRLAAGRTGARTRLPGAERAAMPSPTA